MGSLSLGEEDPKEEDMTTYSSILGWRLPWTKEPGRLQFMGFQRVGHNWNDLAHMHTAVLYPILVEINLEELKCGLESLYSWISVEPLEIVLPFLVCLRNGGALLRHFLGIAKLQLVWILLTPVGTIFNLLGKIPEFPSPSNFKDLTEQHDWDFWSWDIFIAIGHLGSIIQGLIINCSIITSQKSIYQTDSRNLQTQEFANPEGQRVFLSFSASDSVFLLEVLIDRLQCYWDL